MGEWAEDVDNEAMEETDEKVLDDLAEDMHDDE